MKTFYYPDDALPCGYYAATIGFFDGVHRGHQYLIHQLHQAGATRSLSTMVITFDRHPREVVQTGWQPQLLSTLDEKLALLAQTGIDTAVVLRFDTAMAALSARRFMGEILADKLHVKLLLTGYDNRFGHDRTEGFADYQHYGRETGIDVVLAEALQIEGVTGSSSMVRRLLADGRVSEAAIRLGRPYALSGTVVHGEQVGRQIGFPTANLQPDDERKLLPGSGVYAVWAELPDGRRLPAMTNIGTRPTFHGDHLTLETHILARVNNIYGVRLTLHFAGRLRDEQTFPSSEALVHQLEADKATALRILTNNELNEFHELNKS
jgi:riboflavin kinase/FMN adenylyltransferase